MKKNIKTKNNISNNYLPKNLFCPHERSLQKPNFTDEELSKKMGGLAKVLQGVFLNFHPLKLGKSQSLHKIPYYTLFSPILLLGLGLSQI